MTTFSQIDTFVWQHRFFLSPCRHTLDHKTTCRRTSALSARSPSSSRSSTLDTRHLFHLIRLQILLEDVQGTVKVTHSCKNDKMLVAHCTVPRLLVQSWSLERQVVKWCRTRPSTTTTTVITLHYALDITLHSGAQCALVSCGRELGGLVALSPRTRSRTQTNQTTGKGSTM